MPLLRNPQDEQLTTDGGFSGWFQNIWTNVVPTGTMNVLYPGTNTVTTVSVDDLYIVSGVGFPSINAGEDLRDKPSTGIAHVDVSLGDVFIFPPTTDTGEQLSDLVISEAGAGTPEILSQAGSEPVSQDGAFGGWHDAAQTMYYTWENGVMVLKSVNSAPPNLTLQQPATTTAEEPGMASWEDLGDLGLEWVKTQLGLGPDYSYSGTLPAITTAGTATATATGSGGAGMGMPPINPTTGQPYRNLKWDPWKGKWVRCRRRRRKLLTESDYNALLKIQTLKNNSNMNVAIAKALGR